MITRQRGDERKKSKYRVMKEMLAIQNAHTLAHHHVAEADGTSVVPALDEVRFLGQGGGGQGLNDLVGCALVTHEQSTVE